ncbi:MAG: hypothetical protein AAGL11_04685 [Pseudomonadota bacterium]
MPTHYDIEIEARIDLDGMPSAVATVSFNSSSQYIATALRDQNRIVLTEPGKNAPFREIKVSDGPVEITPGGGEYVYVACRGAQTIDVINQQTRIKSIALPGEPYGMSWNGAFKPGKRRIMITCRDPSEKRGLLCVIDEETLEITHTLQVGTKPSGICLDQHRKLLFSANFGDDSVNIIDQTGTRIYHTVATAGRPVIANYSWADQDQIIISLEAGGVLQRLDASRLPPDLSGLTALRRCTPTRTSLTPSCCIPIGQDDLWLAPDRHSECIALVKSSDDIFEQIACFELGTSGETGLGLSQAAIATPGLAGRIYVANRAQNQLVAVSISKTRLP